MNLEFLIIGLLLFGMWCVFGSAAFLVLGFVMLILSSFSGAASVVGGVGPDWADKLSLIDPKFNLREAAKQMILLEDHLFHRYKHCLDCISKHTLFIEGLLEEGVTMDVKGAYADELSGALREFRALLPPHIKKMRDGAATDEDYVDTAIKLRELRKPLAKKYAYYDT